MVGILDITSNTYNSWDFFGLGFGGSGFGIRGWVCVLALGRRFWSFGKLWSSDCKTLRPFWGFSGDALHFSLCFNDNELGTSMQPPVKTAERDQAAILDALAEAGVPFRQNASMSWCLWLLKARSSRLHVKRVLFKSFESRVGQEVWRSGTFSA